MRVAVTVGLMLGTMTLAGCDQVKVMQREKEFKEALKDPDSAKFRKVKVNRDNACGEVNAKNGFGAYGGYKRFITTGGPDGLHLMDPEEGPSKTEQCEFEESWATFCHPSQVGQRSLDVLKACVTYRKQVPELMSPVDRAEVKVWESQINLTELQMRERGARPSTTP